MNEEQELEQPDVEPDEQTEAESTDVEQDTFSREYVEQLRKEAAENRVKAKETQEALDASVSAYRALAVEHAASDVLARPDALQWREEWLNDDGTANLDAIREAATEYADAYPHAAKVVGDVGQGYRGESTSGVDLAGMLRAGA